MSDHADPSALMTAYMQATRVRDVPRLSRLFRPDAAMVGYLGTDRFEDGPEPFFEAMDANPPDPSYRPVIEDLVVSGRIASAILREENLLGFDFRNHFHMLEEDGVWRITSKAFWHLPPPIWGSRDAEAVETPPSVTEIESDHEVSAASTEG